MASITRDIAQTLRHPRTRISDEPADTLRAGELLRELCETAAIAQISTTSVWVAFEQRRQDALQ